MRAALAMAAAVVVATAVYGEPVKAPPSAAEKINVKLKAPAGFDLTVFASPPDVSYPTAVSAAPTGEVFVAVDEQGSLGKTPGGGRIVKLVDTDGDGRADQVTTFAKMEHPRGVIWDASARALYVLHPPFLSVYYDDNLTGVSNRSEVLATGITTEASLASRGADHTTNNIRLGIDGWIYIAMGDFGAVHAVGKDGKVFQKHGGGVVRIRPDGSGIESYSQGQRNIFDVAIDPLMNVFTRDNTNDGDAWNDRLSFIVPTGIYGYPSLFRHFPGDFIDCLNDYGGGAPCGSLFIDEPGMPKGFGHTLMTVDWGADGGAVYTHPLKASGAGYAAPVAEELAMKLPRGTDVDIDGQQHLFLSSWVGATFTYAGPNVGYVIRLSPKGAKPEAFPKLADASDSDLIGYLSSPSGVRRQAAQREILHRGDKPTVGAALKQLAASKGPIEARAAAIFTLKLLQHDAADAALVELTKDESVREFALRELCDRKENTAVPLEPFIKALDDANPRVRLIAAWGIGRLGQRDPAAAATLASHLGDSDMLTAHVAVNGLVTLNAIEPCLKAIDPSTPALATVAGRVLQQIHEPAVVDGLIAKLATIKDPALRATIYKVLCRLNFREADWDGSWWNTRPDTSGPYYKGVEWSETPKIGKALRDAVASEPADVLKGFLLDIEKNKIVIPEATPKIASLALSDAEMCAAVIDLLSDRPAVGNDQIMLLSDVAKGTDRPAALRAKAIAVLVRNSSRRNVLDATVSALEPIAMDDHPAPELATAYAAFLRDPRLAQNLNYFADLAGDKSEGRQRIGFGVLVSVANSRLGRGPGRENAIRAIAAAWDIPEQRASLLHAIGSGKSRGYDEKITAALKDKDAKVVAEAKFAADRVGVKPASMATAENTIDKLGYDQTVALVAKDKDKGDAALGKELFTRQGCIICHTTSTDEAAKGPFLGGVGSKYSRVELSESIMKPSAKIAQGFETQYFRNKAGDITEGFVTRESSDDVEVRNATGVPILIKKADIDRRGKRDTSIMPEKLVDTLTPHDLASLLAYLESLPGK